MRRVTPKAFPDEPLLQDAAAVAEFIRAARTQGGLTLEEAALITGIAKSTMQKLETTPGSVGFATVLHVARELGVSLFAFPAEQRERVRRLTARRVASEADGSVSQGPMTGADQP
ncbi:helix-turn-helix domain-containing protein [Zoogloea sp.]|uniref:helix-turn-helix domain-containing protein n=1 Tax=Zoogloea sp. TaxID=49181 RepID=UPI0035B222C7